MAVADPQHVDEVGRRRTDDDRLPLGDTAMWSERCPATGNRQTILWDRRLIATTSAKDGRETMRSRPSLEEYMSSTYWLLPSPMASRIAMK